MIHAKKVPSAGFTLIELMLSMAFVAVLLIAIAGTTIEIMHIYTKGITVREVNQAGRAIAGDVQRVIATSSPFKVEPSNQSDSKYITNAGGGRLCTGAYTYAWNYGKTKELGGNSSYPSAFNKYKTGSGTIRFAKISDAGGQLCANPALAVRNDKAEELLAPGDRNLAVQEFKVAAGSRDDASGQALYAVKMVLGTNDQEQLNLNPGGVSCLPPSEGGGNEDFCAINQFDFVVRSGNRQGSE